MSRVPATSTEATTGLVCYLVRLNGGSAFIPHRPGLEVFAVPFLTSSIPLLIQVCYRRTLILPL